MTATTSDIERGWYRRFRRGFPFLRPERGSVVLVLLLAFLVAGVNAVDPLVLKFVFDAIEAGNGLERVLGGVAVLFGLLVLREGLGGVGNWLNWRVRLRVQQRMQRQAVDRLHHLPLTFHREQGVGGIVTRMDRGISGYVSALAELSFQTLPSIFFLAVALVFMLRLSVPLTLLVLVFVPLPAVFGALASPEQMRRERRQLDLWSRLYSRFTEILSGIVTVKSFAMEDAEKRRFLRGVREGNEVVLRGVRTDTTWGGIRNFVVGLARLAALVLGGWLAIEGRVTLGTVVAFLGFIGALFGPVQALTGVYQTVRRATVSLDVVLEILDTQDSLGDAPDAVDVGDVRGEVEFDDVGFAYQPGRMILRHVSFVARPGETVAVVGPSGSGKSTLMVLLQRLYDPVEGAIRVDGRDLRQLRQRSLRRRIGVVLQDAMVFDDMVRNVIAWARPDATDAQIEEVARAANAHEFVLRMPDGYSTRVGERGGRLSTGERQRLAIARALLKEPAIVILDEATSALDAESEALVQEALGRLTRGRTTFVIAHRLTTVVGADRILVLRGGRIEDQGTHEELVARGGYYRLLIENQTRGLLRPDRLTD